LATNPRFLLVDEPGAGLSLAEIDHLEAALRNARQAGVGILLVEHNVPLVLELSDQVTVLHLGRVLAHGSPDAIRRDDRVGAAFLGMSQNDDPSALRLNRPSS
jgi:branched-chain amino acid transport system permease protein